MNKYRNYYENLNPTDFIVVVFALILTVLNLVFFQKIEDWLLHVVLNLAFILFVFILAYRDKYHSNLFWKQLHFWYLVPLIFLTFKELYFMIDPIRGVIFDDLLIKADRFIFGFDPTVALYKIANPFLTELLQIVYATFFFLPVILGINLIYNNKEKEFNYSAFLIVYGFFLSYIGYIILPAIGPRFTLHNFEATNSELPGLFLTNFLREIVNSGESIPFGTPNPALVVQRDAFPSGHTEITLIVMYLSVRFKSSTKYFLIPNGTLLIFATVYLRYHYVVDLIGGTVFMIFTIWSGKYLYNWWQVIRGTEKFSP